MISDVKSSELRYDSPCNAVGLFADDEGALNSCIDEVDYRNAVSSRVRDKGVPAVTADCYDFAGVWQVDCRND